MSMNQVASDLYQAISESDERKVKPYDTKAEVLRTEGNIVWVKIPGGVDETPVQRTNNANDGDQVMVRISGGRAWLLGNETSPATDDSMANAATLLANSATQLAEGAGDLAKVAADSASKAQQNADLAFIYANNAQDSADSARASAETALVDLSLVEDVLGTVEWIAMHGYYELSQDTVVNEIKIYYTVTGTAVTTPSGNPHNNMYYELADGVYTLSNDTTVVTGKTYYTVTAMTVTNPTGSPVENDYYELNVDESVQQYIATHLALTNDGLRVTDGGASSLLINTNGVTIRGADGNIIGQYGQGAIIGNTTSYHLEITGQRLSFMNASTEVAYMTGDKLYIPRVVVVNSMQAGNWLWDANTSNHLTLRWNEEIV